MGEAMGVNLKSQSLKEQGFLGTAEDLASACPVSNSTA